LSPADVLQFSSYQKNSPKEYYAPSERRTNNWKNIIHHIIKSKFCYSSKWL